MLKNSVLKNFSSLVMAQVFYKILTFIMMIIVIRYLGAEQFGILSYCLSFVWIFLFLADFGFSELFIRDVSSDKEKFGKYLDTILALKLIIALLLLLPIVLLGWLFSFDSGRFLVILILGISILLDSFMYFFRTIFRVQERMEYESILIAAEAIIKICIVGGIVLFRFNLSRVLLIALALLLVSLINFSINLFVFKTNYRKLRIRLNRKLAQYFLKSSLPFAAVYIFGFMNFRVDTIMLTWFKSNTASGWFNVNYRLIEQLFLIPGALSAVFLPVFSRLSRLPNKINELLGRLVLPMAIFSVIIVILCSVFRNIIIVTLYGKDLLPAADYLIILSLVAIPFFQKPLFEKIAFSFNAQKQICLIYISGFCINIILNLLLLPLWGINGVSFATFLSEVFVVTWSIVMSRRLIRSNLLVESIANNEKQSISQEYVYE